MNAFDPTRREPSFSRHAPRRPQTPHRRRTVSPGLIAAAVALVLALALVAVWLWPAPWQLPELDREPAVAASDGRPERPAPDLPVKQAPPELLPADPDKLVGPGDITAALMQLLGREAVLKYLATTDFPRKAVATLDNLGREHAPVLAWPVVPAPGRFVPAGDGASTMIAAENAMRYWPFVGFIDSIDAAQAVDLYRRMYPTLQQAYRELGFPDRSLHARVLEVIDILLATPEPLQPPKITLTEVKGPIRSTQPWTRYQYADPALERLSSGQKILLRMGPDNRQLLKAKLGQIRQELQLNSSANAPSQDGVRVTP